MGPGLGWALPLISSNARIRRRRRGPVNKKRSRPVVTGQRAAQQKNSPRQWRRPFGRVPRKICSAISTHSHWGGDCTTTMRWQDAGADLPVLPGNSTIFAVFMVVALAVI